MPQRVERQFPAEFVRQGGIATKALVTIQCSRCPARKVHESTTLMPDQVISKRLKSWGWVLGKNRTHDICPACAGVTPVNKLAARFRVVSDGQQVSSPAEVADAVGQERARKSREVAALIDRTFGTPPRDQPPQAPPPEEISRPSVENLPAEGGHILRIEKAVLAMADDLGQMKAAMELMMEQVGSLVGLQKQQIQAIANMSAVSARTGEGIAVGLNMLGAAVRELAESSATRLSGMTDGRPEPHEFDLPALPIRSSEVGRLGGAKDADKGHSRVSSYRDGKNPSKFYTMVHLSKSVWSAAGFRTDDRVFIDRADNETIMIRRAKEGGVKLKKVTDEMVIIQTTKVGNVNFKVGRPAGSKGELVLHA